ncbi:head-tail adaptor protein [Phaeovulum sp. W22_SRMD_FR3]|uniref:head-tail adaptor protein n=1 Tax=Phaeovulum sp. W22_SRMD_FR3 TaxID=3240274 RepID=UPI003F95A702
MLMNEFVRFERRGLDVSDPYGNPQRAWAEIVALRVSVLEQTGREAIAAGRLESTRLATVRFPPPPGIVALTDADRMIWRGQVCKIISVGRFGKGSWGMEVLVEIGGAI